MRERNFALTIMLFGLWYESGDLGIELNVASSFSPPSRDCMRSMLVILCTRTYIWIQGKIFCCLKLVRTYLRFHMEDNLFFFSQIS